MKIDINSIKNSKLNKPSFAGFQHKKSNCGENEYEFNFPHDDGRWDAYLEILSVEKDKRDKHVLTGSLVNKTTKCDLKKIEKGGVVVDLVKDYGLDSNKSFAYRYKLVGKDKDKYKEKNDVKFICDAGTQISGEYGEYNLVCQKGSKVNKGGSMLLVIPDSYNVGWVYDKDGTPVPDEQLKTKAKASVKTFSNKLGGTLAGLEQKIPELEKSGYSRIVSTPLFTDSNSDHGYWVKNAMQMSQSLGNINNYASLQRKMFGAGMNLVADAALVNEGLEGVHFKDVLKWGDKTPCYGWFRAEGLESGPLSMGVFAKNKEHIAHKVVNAPKNYFQDENGKITSETNHKYNPKKPTYIQIFDNRLASKTQKEDNEHLIKEYENKNTNNVMDINTHDDTVVNYPFEIKPEFYEKNIEDLKKINSGRGKDEKIRLHSPMAARILTKSNNYQLEDKFEGGFETWDANTDIAKLNFVMSNADVKLMKNLSHADGVQRESKLLQNNHQAQDYAVASGKYWTKKTNDILLESVAQDLGAVNVGDKDVIKVKENLDNFSKKLKDLVDKKKLPKSVLKEVIKNPDVIKKVLAHRYSLKTLQNTPANVLHKDLLLKGLMDLPLDSIELGDDIVAVLGYPHITNRATVNEDIGASRYDLYKNNDKNLQPEFRKVYNQTQNMYTNELSNFANEVMSKVNDKMADDNKLFQGDKATTFGKYVLPLVGQDIAKFAIIKALDPNAKINVNKDNGEIVYDYNHLKQLSLREVGVIGSSPEDEASSLISKIKSGIRNLSSSDKETITKSVIDRIKNTNANGFMLSEMILDRTQAGLDWRIDATKDIADMGAVGNENTYFEQAWNQVIDFWKNFTSAVTKENPNAYLASEVTDEGIFHAISGGPGRFEDGGDAVAKLLRETGMTATANYNYFFSGVAKAFGKSFETGGDFNPNGINKEVKDYLTSGQLESLLYSYTFVGNHDKPRILHCLALDMDLFHADLNNPQNHKHRQMAAAVLNNKIMDIDDYEIDQKVATTDFSYVSSKAIAMADLVKDAMSKTINDQKYGDMHDQVYKAIGYSIADLAKGHYLDTTFSADAFGTKPFDKVIDMVLTQAEKKHHLELSPDKRAGLINGTFKRMLEPAMSKAKGMMGFLVALPGNPTLFAGDDLGLTGYDEKCKNVYLQNRSFLNWDLLDKDKQQFITDFHKKVNETMALRSDPNLKALNTGAPFVLGDQYDQDGQKSPITGILRQDTDGAVVVSLFNATGTTINNKAEMGGSEVRLSNVSLSGVTGGLPINKIFHSLKDDCRYKVEVDGNTGNYVINKYGKDGKYTTINFSEPNLILYSEPDEKDSKQTNQDGTKTPSFAGRKVLYNPQYSFTSNPYKQSEVPTVGKKLFAQSSS